MSSVKKIEVEITAQKAIIPQSVHESKHEGVIASYGDVIEVYPDVADKLSKSNSCSIVSKENPATIAKEVAAEEEAKRENLPEAPKKKAK